MVVGHQLIDPANQFNQLPFERGDLVLLLAVNFEKNAF
jgi:hypothetical protein